MVRKRARREKAAKGVRLEDYLGAQLRSPEFRHHFTERRMVHEVALAVRALRDRADLTQAELAKRIGSSQPSIARIEKGLGYRTPQWETLDKIARALGKQLKLQFVDADVDEPLVEVNGVPLAPAAARPTERVPRGT
jgi:transcriptional regulator with XRE-family HTH domain